MSDTLTSAYPGTEQGHIRAANSETRNSIRQVDGEERAYVAPYAPEGTNKVYDINISQLDHGYIVKVGCQTLAIEDVEKLISKLGEYLRNPQAGQEKYYSKELLK